MNIWYAGWNLNNFKKIIADEEAATRACFRVAHSIAKCGKPYTDS